MSEPFYAAPTFSFESSFSENVEDLDVAFFIAGYARYGRFVTLGDVSYSKSSRDGRLPAGAGPLPPGIPANGSLQQTSMTLAAGLRAFDLNGIAVDVLGGARHWRIKGSVEVPLAGLSVSPSLLFTDPILAVRANITLADRWSLIVYGDVGGFGAGSDQTSQLVATVNFQMRDDLFVSVGYLTLSVDYI